MAVAGGGLRQAFAAVEFARRDLTRSVRRLKAFIRFPTVSGQAAHAGDIRRCAQWLAEQYGRIGMQRVRVVPTARHPLVYAEWTGAGAAPTLLMYGHYDVQPPGPLAAWRNPPFHAVVHAGAVHGRGSCDDKGPLMCHLAALEALMTVCGRLPVNVRCLVEGEEEIGSPNLGSFLLRNREQLRSDTALISDTRMLGPGQPALVYSLRGGVNAEIEVRGPGRDLHSGGFGGAVLNPAQALAAMLAGLHDGHGRVAVPGFYDRVLEVGDAEREFMRQQGPSDPEILRAAGAGQGWGEPGYTLYERTTIRPALAINGISGGYAGEGGMSVIPARASAKLNLRLVPAQRPAEVGLLLVRHLESLTPAGVSASIRARPSARPATIPRNLPAMKAAARACRKAFHAAPAFVRSGGSIPVAGQLAAILGTPPVLMGFALPDDGMHGPNERFQIKNLRAGTEAVIHFLDLLAGGGE